MATLNEMIAQGAQFNIPDPTAQYNKLAQMQKYQQENELAKMQMEEYGRARQESNALRQFLPGLNESNRSQLLGFGAPGQGVYKTLAEGDTQQRLADQAKSQAAVNKSNILKNAVAQTRDAVAGIDPTDAPSYMALRESVLTQYPELAPHMPAAWDANVKQRLIVTAASVLEGQKPAAPTTLAKLQSEQAALPAGDPRRAEYVAMIRKETTPVAGTTVNVSTEKAYGGAFGGKLAEADIGKLATAEKAPQLADSANRIIDIVNKGDVFTGPAADIKLNIARALNVAGANNQDKIANTESLIAAAGQSTLDAIKSAGLGTGQGFTDKDLKFLQGIAGGTINLTSQTLTNLATLQHRAASRGAESWNKRVKEMPQEVVRGTGLSTAPIQISPLSTSRSAGNVVVTPDGQSHTFPTPAAAAQFKKAAGL